MIFCTYIIIPILSKWSIQRENINFFMKYGIIIRVIEQTDIVSLRVEVQVVEGVVHLVLVLVIGD